MSHTGTNKHAAVFFFYYFGTVCWTWLRMAQPRFNMETLRTEIKWTNVLVMSEIGSTHKTQEARDITSRQTVNKPGKQQQRQQEEQEEQRRRITTMAMHAQPYYVSMQGPSGHIRAS